MKKVIIIIIIIILGLISWKIGEKVNLKLTQHFSSGLAQRIANSELKFTYLLDREKDLWYEIPATDKLKIITIANVPKKHFSFESASLNQYVYAFEFQLFNASGDTIFSDIYYHRSRMSLFRDPINGEFYTSSFYLNFPLIPSDNKFMIIDLRSYNDEAKTLHLKLASTDDDIQDIGVSVNYQNQVPAHKMRYFWYRLNPEEKREFAKGNIYYPELMTNYEIENALRQYWSLLAPKGIEGKEFHRRKIYVIRELANQKIRDSVLPAGFFISPDFYGMVPVPPEGGKFQFEFFHVREHDEQLAQKIDLLWQRDTSPEIVPFTFECDKQPSYFTQTFADGGLLEIRPPHEMIFRVYQSTNEGEVETTPEPRYLRFYVSGMIDMLPFETDTTVNYQVTHDRRQSTPFKVQFRQIKAKSESSELKPVYVEYEMLTADRQVWKKGLLSVDTLITKYDRLTKIWEDYYLTEPTEYYFYLPDVVTEIRFRALIKPLLIIAYNRPPDLNYEVIIPDDRFAYTDTATRMRQWFNLKANNDEYFTRAHRVAVAIVQTRMNEVDERIVNRDYEWESLVPLGNWQARSVLLPYDQSQIFRPALLSSVYRSIPSGQELIMNFQHPENEMYISPRLVYQKQNAAEEKISLYLNNQLFYTARAVGLFGELWLPDVLNGQQSLMLNAPQNMNVLINYVGPDDRLTLQKRTVARLDKNSLSYVYQKSEDEENIMLKWFAPAKFTQPYHINVTFQPDQQVRTLVSSQWTILERDYIICPAGVCADRTESGNKNIVLNTKDEYIDDGQTFVFPLKADIPAGNHLLLIQTEKPLGYLSVGKIIPGQAEKTHIYTEQFSGATK